MRRPLDSTAALVSDFASPRTWVVFLIDSLASIPLTLLVASLQLLGLMGGTISLESTFGVGTKMTVLLPLEKAPLTLVDMPAPDLPPINLVRENTWILVTGEFVAQRRAQHRSATDYPSPLQTTMSSIEKSLPRRSRRVRRLVPASLFQCAHLRHLTVRFNVESASDGLEAIAAVHRRHFDLVSRESEAGSRRKSFAE